MRDDALLRVGKQYEPIADAPATALDSIRTAFDVLDRAARSSSAVLPAPVIVTAAPQTRPGRQKAERDAAELEFAAQTASELRQASRYFHSA